MHIAANRQKDDKAFRLPVAPKAKARQLVSDVIVIAGPASLIALWILSEASSLRSV